MIKDDILTTNRETKHRRVDIATFVFHWLIVASVLYSLLSGIRIAADHSDWRHGMIYHLLQPLLPQGTLLIWHVVSGFVLLVTTVAYILFLLAARQQGRLRFSIRKFQNPQTQYVQLNVLLHWLALILIVGMSITGLFNYLENSESTLTVRKVHFWLAMCFAAYPFVHVFAQYLNGGLSQLLSMFRIRWTRAIAGISAIVISILCIGFWFYDDYLHPETLNVRYVAHAPVIDGQDEDLWHDSPHAQIYTKLGNTPQEQGTWVDVQAMYDGKRIYFKFSWPDEEASLVHLPVVKTASGWQVKQNGFEIDDELDYYEDKFAVMLSAHNPLAAVMSIHLGNRPLDFAKPPRHGRGYHYMLNGELLDIWHWKAVRSNRINQADDNYFTAPFPARTCYARYKAGYHADPKIAGGIKNNWLYFHADKITPKRLPSSSRFVSTLDNLKNAAHSMRWVDAHPYNTRLDKLPVGAVIPSLLTGEPYQGDRSNIGAHGHWQDGRWTAEMTRVLDTKSPYDVAINDGTLMWVAVFNHTQTHHSYHMRPLKISLETKP